MKNYKVKESLEEEKGRKFIYLLLSQLTIGLQFCSCACTMLKLSRE